MCEPVPERAQCRRLSRDGQARVGGDPSRVCAGIDAAGLERGDLRHVEHVPDVEPWSGDLDAAEAVDREVTERMRRGLSREGERRNRKGEKREPLHRRAFLATGNHKIEKCGLIASACRNQPAALGLPRHRSIIARWNTKSASRVPSLSAWAEWARACAQRPALKRPQASASSA